jgi:hypothetical protein
MILWGTFATQSGEPTAEGALARKLWAASAAGTALALYVFMADAIWAIRHGLDAARSVLPTSFNWVAFCTALTLMAMPIAHSGWQASRRRE